MSLSEKPIVSRLRVALAEALDASGLEEVSMVEDVSISLKGGIGLFSRLLVESSYRRSFRLVDAIFVDLFASGLEQERFVGVGASSSGGGTGFPSRA